MHACLSRCLEQTSLRYLHSGRHHPFRQLSVFYRDTRNEDLSKPLPGSNRQRKRKRWPGNFRSYRPHLSHTLCSSIIENCPSTYRFLRTFYYQMLPRHEGVLAQTPKQTTSGTLSQFQLLSDGARYSNRKTPLLFRCRDIIHDCLCGSDVRLARKCLTAFGTARFQRPRTRPPRPFKSCAVSRICEPIGWAGVSRIAGWMLGLLTKVASTLHKLISSFRDFRFRNFSMKSRAFPRVRHAAF
jgi:hypothetical protein